MVSMPAFGRLHANREHRFASDNLSAYLDGELPPGERARVERHLAACADCRRDLETLQETVALVRRVPLVPVPRSFALPATARAVQARHRRWNRAFGVLRTATVTIATMLVIVFAGDAALSTGLVSLPSGRAASEGMALLAPEEYGTPAEDAQPMIAQQVLEAAPVSEPEASTKVVEKVQVTPAEPPAPAETARALQPPRDTWPGPTRQAMEMGGPAEGGQGGGAGGAGGADIGGSTLYLPRPNGVGGGAATDEGEPRATPTAEERVEMLAEPVEAVTAAATEAPQPEAMLAPKMAPAAEPQALAPTAEPTVSAVLSPAADEGAEPARPAGEALAMEAEPPQLPPDRGGEPTPEALRTTPPEREPESTWWLAWRLLRLLSVLLTGLLLIALAGTVWAGYKRGVR